MTKQIVDDDHKVDFYSVLYAIIFPEKKNMRSVLASVIGRHPKTLRRKEKTFNENTSPYDVEYWECHGNLSENDWHHLLYFDYSAEFALPVQLNLTPPEIVRGIHPTYLKLATPLVGLRNVNIEAPQAFFNGCDYLLSLLQAFSQLYYCSLHENKECFMDSLAVLAAKGINAESLWQDYMLMQQKSSLSEKSTLKDLLFDLLEIAFLTLDVIFFTPMLLEDQKLGGSLLLAFAQQVSENSKKKALYYAVRSIRTLILNNLTSQPMRRHSNKLMYALLSKHEDAQEAIRKTLERMSKKPATPEAFGDLLEKIRAVPTAQDKPFLQAALQAVYSAGLLTSLLIDSYMETQKLDRGTAAQALFSSAMNRRSELCEKVLGIPCPVPLTVS